MKKAIRVLSIVVSLSIVMGIVASAEVFNYKKYKKFVYIDDNGPSPRLVITNYLGKKKDITIPAYIDNKRVFEIRGMKKAKTVEVIRIPETIRYITIKDTSNLKKIIIDEDNKDLIVKDGFVLNKDGGYYSEFYEKESVIFTFTGSKTTVDIPETIEDIRDHAFSGAKIKQIDLSENVTRISNNTFDGCKQLEKIVLGNQIKNIGTRAFKNCYKLKNITLDNQMAWVEPETFENCKNLTKVTLGKNITHIWDLAFYNCKKLGKVVFKHDKKLPKIVSNSFDKTKTGIKFYVNNKKLARNLKIKLKKSKVKNARIYVGKKLLFKNVNIKK